MNIVEEYALQRIAVRICGAEGFDRRVFNPVPFDLVRAVVGDFARTDPVAVAVGGSSGTSDAAVESRCFGATLGIAAGAARCFVDTATASFGTSSGAADAAAAALSG